MKWLFVLFLAVSLNTSILGQDEEFFKNIYAPGKTQSNEHFFKTSPSYLIDLDQDGQREKITIKKRDGMDWLSINSFFDREIYSYKFRPTGDKSHIFKIKIRNLSSKTKALLIYYYEGHTNYLNFLGTARLYFITFENRNLKNIRTYKGPIFWHEYRKHNGEYSRRMYSIDFADFNRDGTDDIRVKYHLAKRIFLYQPGGAWRELTESVL